MTRIASVSKTVVAQGSSARTAMSGPERATLASDPYGRLSLSGRVIVVTGASSGIGRATATLLASRGASIVAADVEERGGGEIADEIKRAGGRAVFVRSDVAKEADVINLIGAAISEFGGLHGAFNNAGIEGSTQPLANVSMEQWDRTIAINLTGTFLCLKYEIAHMIEHGGGAIVNTASGAGIVGIPGVADYVASKHGVVGLTRAAAADYSAMGVRVNVILPGAVDTPMLRLHASRTTPRPQTVSGGRPIGRYGTVEEIAEAAAWLLADAAGYATGGVFAVDGGYTCV
jgi:2,5-dichloro-2,5-cyclohexadiene-1,4-diol dehydrogenase 1